MEMWIWIGVSAAFYWGVFFLSGPLCLALFSPLRHKERKEQLGAFIRVPSLVNCAIVVPLASYILLFDAASLPDRVRSTSLLSSALLSSAAGYFVFDVMHAAYDYHGPAFLAHGLLCSTVYALALLTPFVHYYGTVFLLYEVSTIFLNIGYFLKSVYEYPSNSPLMMLVNILFALAFLLCRLVYGTYESYFFFLDMRELIRVQGGLSLHPILFGLINILLGCLNIFWFSKIVKMIVGGGGGGGKHKGAQKTKRA